MTDDSNPSVESTELDEILANYMFADEAGEPVSRNELLARHPEYAGQLNQFFADRDQFRRLASPLSPEAARHNDLPANLRYFGDYELLEEIAQGGMGVVYKARQTSLNRIVAVKMVLAGHLATDQDIQRFELEAKTAATLKHRSIVPIHEVGQQSGQHYFSMDYIDGDNLAEVIRTNPPLPQEAARIIKDVAEAVDYAHQEGVVHRDIKPSNILIDTAGQIHITDFGLAMRVESKHNLTRTGQVLGTPSYMSPEQARGKHELVGPATDIYAMGAVLYELLTGRPPFRNESSVQTIKQVIDADPVPPSKLTNKLQRDLETVCLKCLDKMPHKRYGTAALVADDLGRFIAGEPVRARRIGRIERTVRYCRREPLVATLASLAAILLFSGVCVSTVFAVLANKRALAENDARKRAEAQTQRANDLIVQVRSERDRANKNARELLRSNFNFTLNRAQALLEERKEQARASLEDVQRCPPDLRDFAWGFLARESVSETVQWKHSDRVLSVAFSRDGKWVASGDDSGVIRFTDANSGEELRSVQAHRSKVQCLELTPNGHTLASAGRNGEICFWDSNGTKLTQWLAPPRRQIWEMEFSPDGSRLAIAYQAGFILVWSPVTGESYKLDDGVEAPFHCVAYSPDGSMLAAGSNDRNDDAVVVWDVAARALRLRCMGHGKTVWGLDFSADSTRLLSSGMDNTIKLWNANTGEELRTFLGHEGNVRSVKFMPDSNREFISSSNDGTVRRWQVGQLTPVETMRAHLDAVPRFAIGTEGRIASAGRDYIVRIWKPTQETRESSFLAHPNGVLDLSISPRTGEIATCGLDEKIRIWNGPGELVQELIGHSREVVSVCYDSNGERLASSSGDGTVRLWNIEDGKEIESIAEVAKFPDGRDSIIPSRPLAFSLDGRILASTSGAHSSNISLRTEGFTRKVSLKAMNPNLRMSIGGIMALCFSPTGDVLAWGGGYAHRGVCLVELESMQEIRVLQGHYSAVTTIGYSPSGKFIASGGLDDTVILWDAITGQRISTLRGHHGNIRAVTFSPDEKTLATAGDDKSILLWDASTGQLRASLNQHEDIVTCLGFTKDGRTLVSGSMDGTVQLWHAQVY